MSVRDSHRCKVLYAVWKIIWAQWRLIQLSAASTPVSVQISDCTVFDKRPKLQSMQPVCSLDPHGRERRKAASCSGKKTVCQQGFASDSRLWEQHKSPVEHVCKTFILLFSLLSFLLQLVEFIHVSQNGGCVRKELHDRKLKPFQIFILKVNTCLC